jgi:hypothetical protein
MRAGAARDAPPRELRTDGMNCLSGRARASREGGNDRNQAGLASPTNAARTLLDLLSHWKRNTP